MGLQDISLKRKKMWEGETFTFCVKKKPKKNPCSNMNFSQFSFFFLKNIYFILQYYWCGTNGKQT